MNEIDILNLGFKPDLDSDGKKLSFHPEGCTFYLNSEYVIIYTTSNYPYIWIIYETLNFGKIHELVSHKFDMNIIEDLKKLKNEQDVNLYLEKHREKKYQEYLNKNKP